jgi:hypothetical protein
MAYLYGSDLASGGWDALNNITATIGTGVFPKAQRETIVSETVQAAGGTGQTYRPTLLENQSMIETDFWRDRGWFGSPYQDNLSVTRKVQEGKQTAALIEPEKDAIGESLDWALGTTKQVTTLFDELRGLWEPREVIREKPYAGSPDGKNVRNLNEVVERGAEVIKAGGAIVGRIFDQVKGLFNLGYPQSGKQPVFAIQHEIDPTVKTGLGVFGVIVLILVVLMLMRKK